MKYDLLTDEMLEKAVKKACEEECEKEYLSLEDSEEHIFSPKFERDMKELIKDSKSIPFRRKKKIKMRYLLVAVLSFAFSYITVLTVEPVQGRIVEGLKKLTQIDDSSKNAAPENADGVTFAIENPTYIPQGYENAEWTVKIRDERYAVYECNYIGADNYKLTYIQATPSFWEAYEPHLKAEGEESVSYISDKYVFYISGTVAKNDLIKMLKSLKES